VGNKRESRGGALLRFKPTPRGMGQGVETKRGGPGGVLRFRKFGEKFLRPGLAVRGRPIFG